MFLKDDKSRARREMDCFHCCIKASQDHMERGNYAKVAVYLENAARSARDLEAMHQTKKAFNQSRERIKETAGEQSANDILEKVRLNHE